MKKSILILFIYFFGINLSAQTPEWQWIAQAGGTGWDELYDMALDNSGNIYITGWFMETAIFGSDTLTSKGEMDIFVAKLNANGNWEWAAQAGGIGWDSGFGIAVDDVGNSYITGFFSETAFFNSGPISSSGNTLISTDEKDIFVAKIDADGNWIWVVQAGGNDMDMVHGIAIDDLNNIFITGRYYDSISFGTSHFSNYGGENYSDAFVAKLSSEGDWLWVSHIGGVHNDCGSAITIDEEGNAIVTGNFEHYSSFGDFTLHSQGNEDIFVAEVSSDGNWEWVTQAGGIYNDFGNDVAIDSSNNINLTGGFYISATFGSETISSMGLMDVFISKLDSEGNWLSVAHAGGWEYDYGLAITTDEIDNSYITGYFTDTAFFDPFSLMGNMGSEIYVAKLDTENNWEWAISAGGIIGDKGYGIELDNLGNIYLAGRFMDVATFGSFNLTSNGYSDIFVAKLNNPLSAVNEFIKPALQLSNYPNPFNPETNIVFNLPEAGEAQLNIYNLKGEKVKDLSPNLCHPEFIEGRGETKYSVTWDGKDENNNPVSSGIYFYQLKVDGKEIASRKCMLLK